MTTAMKWSKYIRDYESFSYTFYLLIDNSNYIDVILALDSYIFLKGKKFGIYDISLVDESKSIKELRENYELTRRRKFFQQKNDKYNFPTFLNLQHWDLFRSKVLELQSGDAEVTKIPVFHNNEISVQNVSASKFNNNYSIIEWDDGLCPSMENLRFKNSWQQLVGLTLRSSSNIWWEELEFETNDYGRIKNGSAYVNNRPTSYRITPRFNSFLRDVSKKVGDLGGKINFESDVEKFATPDGILLDGKIIYQEDIDEGRIEVPAF